MFIRAKPYQVGFKIWGLCEIDGNRYPPKIYPRKESIATAPLELFGKRVVKTMVGIIAKNPEVLSNKVNH